MYMSDESNVHVILKEACITYVIVPRIGGAWVRTSVPASHAQWLTETRTRFDRYEHTTVNSSRAHTVYNSVQSEITRTKYACIIGSYTRAENILDPITHGYIATSNHSPQQLRNPTVPKIAIIISSVFHIHYPAPVFIHTPSNSS